MLLLIPSELDVVSVTPIQHRKLFFKHNEQACNNLLRSVKFDRVLHLILRKNLIFSVRGKSFFLKLHI